MYNPDYGKHSKHYVIICNVVNCAAIKASNRMLLVIGELKLNVISLTMISTHNVIAMHNDSEHLPLLSYIKVY